MAEMSADSSSTPGPILRPLARPIHLGLLVNARLLRLLIGFGLVAVAGWYIYLYAFNRVSVAAVVNAPLVTIVSQIDGYVAADSVGRETDLVAGQALVTVVDDRVDTRTEAELAGSREAARQRLTALQASIAELTTIKEDLARRSRNHLAAW